MFESLSKKEKGLGVLLKRAFLLVAGLYFVIGMMAGYRAWFQVKSLELQSRDLILRQGSIIETRVVSYARTPVRVRVELIQGTHTETLAVQLVMDNWWAFGDPRTRRASQTAVLTQDVLGRFEPGRATVRATAIGGPQWTRVPPPLVRELDVEIGDQRSEVRGQRSEIRRQTIQSVSVVLAFCVFHLHNGFAARCAEAAMPFREGFLDYRGCAPGA